MKYKYQKLFKNYKISKEENDWCEAFSRNACFEPIFTDSVIDQMSFLEMIEKNNEHCLEAAHEAVHSSDKMKYKLPYFKWQ